MPPALPGFHYDPEKKKYFKIQPNHVAAHPSARKYSKAALKQEAEERHERKRRELFEHREKTMRLQRSKVLESPLGGGWGAMRELGVTEAKSTVVMRSWAQGLQGKKVERFHLPDHGSGPFVFDSATGVLTYADAVGVSGGDIQSIMRHLTVAPVDGFGEENLAGLSPEETSPMATSQVVSMSILPSRVLMTTAMGGSRPAYVYLTSLVDPKEWRARYQANLATHLSERHYNDPLLFTSDVSTVIYGPLYCTFWASSPRPDCTTSDFAIATTFGTAFVPELQSSWSLDRIQKFESERGYHTGAAVEVLAVDWLDANVLLNGCRDGIVRLWDTRVQSVHGGTSARVRHGSCINHVRRLDGRNRIVVAGLEEGMAVYDLRCLPAKKGLTRGPTRPYVEFPGYRNKEFNGVAAGFDVCGEMIAAGTDGVSGWQIFDAASGREVVVGRGGGEDLGGPARCLQFVEMEEGRQGTSLYVANGTGIEQWAW